MKQITDDAHYVLIIDGQGIIANANDSACRILGYTRDELVGQYFTLFNPNISKEVGEKFFGPDSVLSEDNYFKLDTNHKSKDGRNIPITACYKLYKPNKRERYLLILAELKKTTDNEKVFVKDKIEFLENACDFYFDIDKDGIIEYVSLSVERLSGFSQEEVIGQNYFDFIPVEKRGKDRETFEYFALNGQPYRVTHDITIDKKGRVMNGELYFTSRLDDYGKFVGYRVIGWMEKGQNSGKLLDG